MHEKNEEEKEKRMKRIEGDGQVLYYLRMRQLFCTSSSYMELLSRIAVGLQMQKYLLYAHPTLLVLDGTLYLEAQLGLVLLSKVFIGT